MGSCNLRDGIASAQALCSEDDTSNAESIPALSVLTMPAMNDFVLGILTPQASACVPALPSVEENPNILFAFSEAKSGKSSGGEKGSGRSRSWK